MRIALAKKTRFEIFKRDSFTCQYCGKSAPSVILQVDHIMPVSNGGDNDISNLITSCLDCNQGKKDRLLDDDAVIIKRKKQLDNLQERREQIEMMLEWQENLINLDQEEVSVICKLWNKKVPGYSINDNGKDSIKKVIKKFGLNEVIESLNISVNQYLTFIDGKLDPESVTKTYEYIGKICRNRKRLQDKPYLADLYKILSVMKYKFRIYQGWQVIDLLESAYLLGVDADQLSEISKRADNYCGWEKTMVELIERLERTNGK